MKTLNEIAKENGFKIENIVGSEGDLIYPVNKFGFGYWRRMLVLNMITAIETWTNSANVPEVQGEQLSERRLEDAAAGFCD